MKILPFVYSHLSTTIHLEANSEGTFTLSLDRVRVFWFLRFGITKGIAMWTVIYDPFTNCQDLYEMIEIMRSRLRLLWAWCFTLWLFDGRIVDLDSKDLGRASWALLGWVNPTDEHVHEDDLALRMVCFAMGRQDGACIRCIPRKRHRYGCQTSKWRTMNYMTLNWVDWM